MGKVYSRTVAVCVCKDRTKNWVKVVHKGCSSNRLPTNLKVNGLRACRRRRRWRRMPGGFRSSVLHNLCTVKRVEWSRRAKGSACGTYYVFRNARVFRGGLLPSVCGDLLRKTRYKKKPMQENRIKLVRYFCQNRVSFYLIFLCCVVPLNPCAFLSIL